MAGTDPPSELTIAAPKYAVAPIPRRSICRLPAHQQADAAIRQRCSLSATQRTQFDEGRGMLIGKIAAAAAVAVFTFVGVAPTAGATTYTQTLPAGCTAPTLSGTTVYATAHRLFAIIDYPAVAARTRCAGWRLRHHLRDAELQRALLGAAGKRPGLHTDPSIEHDLSLAYVYGTDRTPSGCQCSRDSTNRHVRRRSADEHRPAGQFVLALRHQRQPYTECRRHVQCRSAR